MNARALIEASNFNSRPYVRGDPAGIKVNCNSVLFQFTPLREGRLEHLLSV